MKMLHQKKSVLQIFRLLVQIAFFIFLPSLYYSTFQGIKQFYQSIMQGTFDLTALLPQMIEAIAIIPLTILLGRFFCGWMCAFGALSDFIYRITGEFVKVKLSERSDRILKSLKYVWLLVLIVVFWSFDITVLNALSPWNVFGMLATFGKTPDFSYVAANLFGGLLFLILILGASAVVERFFCRYLCPLGALLSLGSLLRIAKIRKPAEHCGNCRICTNQCAMGIPLYQKNIVKTGECINCMKCVTACPRHNVSLAVAGEDIRPVLASTMAVAAMTGMYYTVNLAERMTGVTTATAAVTPSSSAGTSSQDTSSDSSQSSSQQTVTSGDAKASSAA
ncbi:MAG TPA: 4Fe-4S binding protein, partial [Clostridia bacterium]|nr:4Fe-4S binding protein [Clostridia bacterium]